MSGFHWIGLMAAVVAALLVTGVIGLVRICLEVEQVAPEERADRDHHPGGGSLNRWGSAS